MTTTRKLKKNKLCFNSESAICVTVKLGVGGFSMGAATALHSATCFTVGKYGNGNPYPANLCAAVGLSGWLPCAKFGILILLKLILVSPNFVYYLTKFLNFCSCLGP